MMLGNMKVTVLQIVSGNLNPRDIKTVDSVVGALMICVIAILTSAQDFVECLDEYPDIESRYDATMSLYHRYYECDITTEEGWAQRAVSIPLRSYNSCEVSILELIDAWCGTLGNSQPDLLLELASTVFPNYSFQLSTDPEDLSLVYAITPNGRKSLYQVAKHEGSANKQFWIPGPSTREAFQEILESFSDRPHIADVIQEVLDGVGQGLLGPFGCYARIAVLIKDEPDLSDGLVTLEELQSAAWQDENDYFPRFNYRGFVLEALSKESYQELLDRVEQQRQLRLLMDNVKSLKL